jgi:hypothetical protein
VIIRAVHSSNIRTFAPPEAKPAEILQCGSDEL